MTDRPGGGKTEDRTISGGDIRAGIGNGEGGCTIAIADGARICISQYKTCVVAYAHTSQTAAVYDRTAVGRTEEADRPSGVDRSGHAASLDDAVVYRAEKRRLLRTVYDEFERFDFAAFCKRVEERRVQRERVRIAVKLSLEGRCGRPALACHVHVAVEPDTGICKSGVAVQRVCQDPDLVGICDNIGICLCSASAYTGESMCTGRDHDGDQNGRQEAKDQSDVLHFIPLGLLTGSVQEQCIQQFQTP